MTKSLAPICIADLTRFRYLSSVAVSPNQEFISFVAKRVDLEANTYPASLYVYSRAQRTLTSIVVDSQILAHVWEPEGGKLLVAEASSEHLGWTRVAQLSPEGERASGLQRDLPYRIRKLLAYGSTVYFTARTFRTSPASRGCDEAEALVFEEIPCSQNGEGYIAGSEIGLLVADLDSGDVRPLLENRNVLDFDVRNGSVAAVCGTKNVHWPLYDTLLLLNQNTGEQRVLSEGEFVMSRPAGVRFLTESHLAFLGTDAQLFGYRQSREILLHDLMNGVTRSLTPGWDQMAGNVLNSDCRHGGGAAMAVSGESVFALTTGRTSTQLVKVSRAGEASIIASTGGSLDSFDVQGDVVSYIEMGQDTLQEVSLLVPGGKCERISSLNRHALSGNWVGHAERFPVESNGDSIDAWMLPPFNMEEGHKYPTILMIHGGPKTTYGNAFMHEMHVLSGEGYAVVYANPHGSAGRGDAFADLGSQYGEIDREDLMAVVSHALQRFPFLDSARLGVSGGSYGGYLVNLILGRSDQFKAACAQRSIANWISKFATGDNGYFVNHDRGTPWTNAEMLWERSPLRWADRIRTPTLLIHSEEDMNCPKTEAFQMLTALRLNEIPARLVLFPGENHNLSRTGRPRARLRRLREIVRWFDMYLKTSSATESGRHE